MRIRVRSFVPCSLALVLALACTKKGAEDADADADAKTKPEAQTEAGEEAVAAAEPATPEAKPEAVEPPKPAAEVEAPPAEPVVVEPDTVPIAPIKLVAASVSWREAASPTEPLSLVALDGGVLASGSSGYYDVADDGQLVLRAEIEAPAGTILGEWPKDAWYVETRTKTIDGGRADEEVTQIRLMRLRGKKRWVPQEYAYEQRWVDYGHLIRKSKTGGMFVLEPTDEFAGVDNMDDGTWERVADNGSAPEFGVTHGDEVVEFFETGARKFYTASKGMGRPHYEPPADEPAPPQDPPAGEDAPTPEAEGTSGPAPEAPEAEAPEVEAPVAEAPEAEAPAEADVPSLFVQTYCDDLECVVNRARMLPLGVDWDFADQAPRKRHHLSAVANNEGRAFLLHYENKDWLLEEKTQAGSFRGMWPTKDGGLWVRVDDQLWHRDPDGGWRNIELPESMADLSVAINGDNTELWIAGMLDSKPVMFATQAAAQELPPEEPAVEGAKG